MGFDFQCQQVLKFLQHKVSPLVIVADYFYHVEFHHHGSSHIHMVMWIKMYQYLKITLTTKLLVVQYIDKVIICCRPCPNAEPELAVFVAYQIHCHSHTCCKGKRFQFRSQLPDSSHATNKNSTPSSGR